jgi:hypothetical protein
LRDEHLLPNKFDLEDQLGLACLDEPVTSLRELRGMVVIDEVQRRPELPSQIFHKPSCPKPS